MLLCAMVKRFAASQNKIGFRCRISYIDMDSVVIVRASYWHPPATNCCNCPFVTDPSVATTAGSRVPLLSLMLLQFPDSCTSNVDWLSSHSQYYIPLPTRGHHVLYNQSYLLRKKMDEIMKLNYKIRYF